MSSIFEEVDGKTYTAEYTSDGDVVTVYGLGDSKSTGINGMNEESVARMLLRHLVREGKAEEITN